MNKFLPFFIMIVTSFLSCSSYNYETQKLQGVFTRLETQAERYYTKLGIKIYDVDIIASTDKDDISKKSRLKIWMFHKDFESISYEEKLEFERYYQHVKDLYNSRTEFVDEYYNYFTTAQKLTDLHIYGYENPRLLVADPTINQLTIKLLEKYFSKKVDMDRLNQVNIRLLQYWQNPINGGMAQRVEMRRKIHDVIKAIDYCKTHTDKEVVEPILAKTYTVK